LLAHRTVWRGRKFADCTLKTKGLEHPFGILTLNGAGVDKYITKPLWQAVPTISVVELPMNTFKVLAVLQRTNLSIKPIAL
jgi:hypothetical protein